MKYLAIFDLGKVQSATAHDTEAAAEEAIKACATAAKTKALKNAENETFILSMPNGQELPAHVEPIDTNVKYQLTYTKNGNSVETSYYPTRAAAVKQAHKILDDLDFQAGDHEDQLGKWSVVNTEQNLNVNLEVKLVLVGSAQDNVVAAYSSYDMKYVGEHFAELEDQLAPPKVAITKDIKQEGRKKGFINLGIGLGIAALGGILTLISYNTAKPGETYTVYTGIIAIGVVDAVYGLYLLANPKAIVPKDKRK